MELPKNYEWLNKESGPKLILEALKLFGTVETPGKGNNPVILSWADEIGGKVDDIYKADEIPWCGLFVAVIVKRTGRQVVTDPLWALNWGAFGIYSPEPMLGDILVFVRKTSDGKKAGHVGLYVGEDSSAYHVLGGNQSDLVCITRIDKTRLYIARRPKYNIQPANVRKVKLSPLGTLSQNEQ